MKISYCAVPYAPYKFNRASKEPYFLLHLHSARLRNAATHFLTINLVHGTLTLARKGSMSSATKLTNHAASLLDIKGPSFLVLKKGLCVEPIRNYFIYTG